jgi:hypothetical protein
MVVTTKERRSKVVDVDTRVPRQNTRIRLRPTTTSPGPVAGETLVARAIAAGAADPAQAAQRLLDAADRGVEPLRSARSTLTRRLQLRSDDFEATLALRIVERALAEARIRTGRGDGRTTSAPAEYGRRGGGPPAAVTGPRCWNGISMQPDVGERG